MKNHRKYDTIPQDGLARYHESQRKFVSAHLALVQLWLCLSLQVVDPILHV